MANPSVGWPAVRSARSHLLDGATVVFVVGLDATPADGPGGRCSADVLAPAERALVDRFATEALRRHHGNARRWRRMLIGAVLGVAPADVRFTRRACVACGGLHGKPALVDDGELDLRVNASSSDGFGAVALRAGEEVGVDIETALRLATLPPAPAWLDPAEQLLVAGSVDPAAERGRAWVRKEAVLKASGVGLNRPLADTPVLPAGRAAESWPGMQVADFTGPGEVGHAGLFGAVAGVRQELVTVAVHPALTG